jgi:hypothetical protein
MTEVAATVVAVTAKRSIEPETTVSVKRLKEDDAVTVKAEREVYFVGLVHNTAAFPYNMARALVTAALESGKYSFVKTVSVRGMMHAMLTPLVGLDDGAFDPQILAQPMPWRTTVDNSEKYAAIFIEMSEAVEFGIQQGFFNFSFRAMVRRLLFDNEVKGKTLLIVTDIRSAEEMTMLAEQLGAKKCMFVRALGSETTRRRIACSEIDGSILETFYTKVPLARFAFCVDSNSPEATLDLVETAVVNLAD